MQENACSTPMANARRIRPRRMVSSVPEYIGGTIWNSGVAPGLFGLVVRLPAITYSLLQNTNRRLPFVPAGQDEEPPEYPFAAGLDVGAELTTEPRLQKIGIRNTRSGVGPWPPPGNPAVDSWKIGRPWESLICRRPFLKNGWAMQIM